MNSPLKKPSALQVAKAIIKLSHPEHEDYISNLKLQKLLYYLQGYHLAVFNQPLFPEKIFKWQYGPVVKEVYGKYKDFGSTVILPEDDFDGTEIFNQDQIDLLFDVYDNYAQFSAFKLSEMTHREDPWKKTEMNQEITHESMKKFFINKTIHA